MKYKFLKAFPCLTMASKDQDIRSTLLKTYPGPGNSKDVYLIKETYKRHSFSSKSPRRKKYDEDAHKEEHLEKHDKEEHRDDTKDRHRHSRKHDEDRQKHKHDLRYSSHRPDEEKQTGLSDRRKRGEEEQRHSSSGSSVGNKDRPDKTRMRDKSPSSQQPTVSSASESQPKGQTSKKDMLRFMIHEVRALRKQLDPSMDERGKSHADGPRDRRLSKDTVTSTTSKTTGTSSDGFFVEKEVHHTEVVKVQKKPRSHRRSSSSPSRKKRLLPVLPMEMSKTRISKQGHVLSPHSPDLPMSPAQQQLALQLK